MAELAANPSAGAPLPRWNWQKIFLFTASCLASTIVLKYGAIQYLELVYLGLIFLLLMVFVHHGYKAQWFRPFLWLALCYAAFCLAAFGLSLAAFARFDFYFPIWLDYLKQPVLITLARTVELVASLAAMLYIAELLRKDLGKARFSLRVYFWTGFASGVYSLLSWPFSLAGVQGLGAYSNIHRLRGFYNEGGPYGIYVLSVLMVGIVIERLAWERRGRIRAAIAVMAVVFLMSYSKAGVFALICVYAINALFARSMTQRVAVLGATLAVLLVLSRFVDVAATLRGLQQTSADYERLSHFHSHDPNFVYGRIAGAYIVPRMIAAHPWSGVGWGNYGVLRNAPEYRGAAVFVNDADDPGLGIFGIAAELGLPLLAFLLLCLFLPFLYLRRLHAPGYVANLALLQPFAHLFGAQLNLTYPWVVTAFALGIGYGLVYNHPATAAPPDLPVS